jgi:hypothetical protein
MFDTGRGLQRHFLSAYSVRKMRVMANTVKGSTHRCFLLLCTEFSML